MEIKFAKLSKNAVTPTRKHETDAGIDFYANDDVIVFGGYIAIVGTGITVEIPKGFFLMLKPKGRADFLIGAGVVDEGYQGEILVKIFNPTSTPVQIKSGEAIAQGVLIPTVYPTIKEVEKNKIHVKKTARKASGGIVDEKQAIFLTDLEIE